jgi:hypothetical protein
MTTATVGCMSEFKVEKYADFGTSEPWLARIMMGLPRLVNVVPAFVSRREAFQAALGETHEALAMAFNDLRRIQQLARDDSVPALDRTKAYENLYGHLWQAYKDRFQKLMRALGYEVGFLFQNDAAFEKGAAKFLEQHPELADLVEMMRRDRADFQKRLGEYRNDYIEHRKDFDPKLFEALHSPGVAEVMFYNAWQAIEDNVALLVQALLPPQIQLVDIPEADRDPGAPERFQFAIASRAGAVSTRSRRRS